MKYLQYIGFLALSVLIASCSTGGSDVSDSSGSGSTQVAVTIGERSAGGSAEQGPELFPASVESFEFTVTGPGMNTMGQVVDLQGRTSITVIFIVPNGLNRCFAINALNAVGGVAYSGISCVDIGGAPITVTVKMQQECYLYVDVNIGDDSANDCTDPNNPCQTITWALTQTAGDEAVCVAAGTYTPPGDLDLLPGTSLICQGAGYSTIIENSTINGAAGALIQGCQLFDSDYPIDDQGFAITVNDCLIDGDNRINCYGPYLTGDSVIMNSTIQDFCYYGIEVDGSASPTIKNNYLTGNDNYGAIYSDSTGSLVISDNRIINNYDAGIELEDGSATITGNTITGNTYDGIYVSTAANGGLISNNTITGNNGSGIYIVSSANPTVSSNSISCNTYADLEIYSTSTITAINNSWDHDGTTSPTGPTINAGGNCSGSGVDICYWGGGYGTPAPSYMPILPAVPGGCL